MKYILFVTACIFAGSSSVNHLFHSKTAHSVLSSKGMSMDVVETTTDSTKPVINMSIKEKMDAHVVHFTGAVMSDTFVVSHFSRAFVDDEYSDFLKPGKYNNGSTCLPKSIASSLDGIAIPKKTKLVVYNNLNLTGTKVLEITGPAIVNNDIWETSDFYSVANKKFFSRDLQDIFPQQVRRYTAKGNNGMSSWYTFSLEITATN